MLINKKKQVIKQHGEYMKNEQEEIKELLSHILNKLERIEKKIKRGIGVYFVNTPDDKKNI